MKPQRSRIFFKALLMLVFIMLAIYAGLFLGYQQLVHESNLYTEQLTAGIRIAVVAPLAP